MNPVLLYFFLLKLEYYEPELVFYIKNLLGVPKYKLGDRFRFRNSLTNNIYNVIKIDKIMLSNIPHKNKKQMVYYKYSYTREDIYNLQVVKYIYDFFIDESYVELVTQPSMP